MARNETEQVRQLQRTLYRTAKQSKAVKFYSLYDKVWRIDVLWEAWKQVKENQGAPGVDGETIDGIVSRGEEGLMLSRLQDQLRAKTYRFQPNPVKNKEESRQKVQEIVARLTALTR